MFYVVNNKKIGCFFRLFVKHLGLRSVTLCSFVLIFSVLLISGAFVFNECAYDRFYTHTDRMVRFSVAFDGKQVDGRIWGNWTDPVLEA